MHLIELSHPKNNTIAIFVNIKAPSICKMFFSIDSLEIIPKNTPKNIIHTKMITNDIIKEEITSSFTKKKGKIATSPPKKGLTPFTMDTMITEKFSAFSYIVFSFFFSFLLL